MTILQLKVIVLTNELGSISAAAKQLGISQPNASNCIKTLESEIGFSVFTRAKEGVGLTNKGQRFLQHAQRIIREQDSIMEMQHQDDVYRLRIGSNHYSAAKPPFITLCSNHRGDVDADFRYFNVSIEDGLIQVKNYKLDLLVAPAMAYQIIGFQNACKKNNLIVQHICDVPTAIFLRKGHPAVADGRCINLTQGSDKMKEFPYVVYQKLTDDSNRTSSNEGSVVNDSDFVHCSYKIYVDDADVRLKVIANSNAFGFGIPSPFLDHSDYGLEVFPVPGITVSVFVVYRPTDKDSREINEYIELLNHEMVQYQK